MSAYRIAREKIEKSIFIKSMVLEKKNLKNTRLWVRLSLKKFFKKIKPEALMVLEKS